MNNKVFYTPGTFGNYVAFLIDSKNKGSLDHDPFTQSGSSHNRNVETKSYDIISQMMTPDQQELMFGNPNYFGNQKFRTVVWF